MILTIMFVIILCITLFMTIMRDMIFRIMIILFKLVCPWQRTGTFLVSFQEVEGHKINFVSFRIPDVS
jgi:hypothetical protein